MNALQRLIIGSFSAASNVTGVLTSIPTVTLLLHEFDALALFDCAACAPYIDIDMGADDLRSGAYKGFSEVSHRIERARQFRGLPYPDAVFISTHKVGRRSR